MTTLFFAFQLAGGELVTHSITFLVMTITCTQYCHMLEPVSLFKEDTIFCPKATKASSCPRWLFLWLGAYVTGVAWRGARVLLLLLRGRPIVISADCICRYTCRYICRYISAKFSLICYLQIGLISADN